MINDLLGLSAADGNNSPKLSVRIDPVDYKYAGLPTENNSTNLKGSLAVGFDG